MHGLFFYWEIRRSWSEDDMGVEPLLSQTRRLLRRFGVRARKGLGQHFLVDEEVLRWITSAAALDPTDMVIEVGPGLGLLTRELATRAGRVIAVELDDRLAAALKRELAAFDNLAVVNEDILKVTPAELLRQRTVDDFGYKVVANLPYYITAPVLRYFLEARPKPGMMVVMVQKEVAEVIAARPGQMSLLSVSVQYYGRPEIVASVPARCFYPVPEVDSALLRIDLYPRPAVEVADGDGFFALVRAGFSAARKQLANSLTQGLGLPKDRAMALLNGAGIDRRRRAETLTLEEWAQLWQVSAQEREEE